MLDSATAGKQRELLRAWISGALKRSELERDEQQRHQAEQSRANAAATSRSAALTRDRDDVNRQGEQLAEAAGQLKYEVLEMREQCAAVAAEIGLKDVRLIAAAQVCDGDSSAGLQRAHREAESAVEEIRAALRDLEAEEGSEQLVRGGAAIVICLLVTWLVGRYYSETASALLFPLLAGGLVAALRVRFGVRGMAKLMKWVREGQPQRASKAWYNPKRIWANGVAAIGRATGGIEDSYIQSGVQVAGVAYYTGSAIFVFVVAGYVIAVSAIAVAVLALMFWGIANALKR